MPRLTGNNRCTKRVYSTKREAKRVLRQAQSSAGCSVKRVYKCPRCGAWHTTSMRKV